MSSLQSAVRMSLVARFIGRTESFANPHSSLSLQNAIDEERKSQDGLSEENDEENCKNYGSKRNTMKQKQNKADNSMAHLKVER